MDGDKVAVKRSRNPSGQNEEHGAEGRKLFRHHSMDDSLESGSERSLGRSVSDTSSALTSFSLPSSYGDDAEPMETSDVRNESVVQEGKKKEKVSQRPKEPKKEHGSVSKQKEEKKKYEHRKSIDREQTTAQYKINLRLCKGSWGDKPYRDSAKDELLKCINAAGNSYGNNVVMDCSETEFGPKDELNTFYKAIEESELRGLVGEELVQKKETLQKELPLHVPMFKNFRSLKTNSFDPKYESVNMKNDDLCRNILHDVKEGIRDGSKRLQSFTKVEKKINSYLQNLKYNDVINHGKETPSVQFKYLVPKKNKEFSKDCFNDRNKLHKYVSAFATYDGGVILYGIEDKTGFVKGQVLSHEKSELHSFDKICETLKKKIQDKTLWWEPDNSNMDASQVQKFFSITEYPIQKTSIPEDEKRLLSKNEYLAVICVKIKPFVDFNEPHGPRDGIVFGSKRGPEAYRINAETRKIYRLTFEEWLKETMAKSEIERVTGKLQSMHLSYDSVSDRVPVFQLHESAKRIRDRLFKVTKDYEVYPESFMSDSLVMRIKEKFQGDGSKGIILVDQHINPSVGIYLFVISNKHGLHHYLIRSSETDSDDESHAEELNDHLQKKAMSFKTSLCSKGGCTKDLEIHTQVVEDDSQIHIPESSSMLTNTEVNTILDSYIKVVGCFENQILSKLIGVEIFNVLTESQFKILTQFINCRELWVHGLAGSGKTTLAQLFMKRLVESDEGMVLYVAENKGLVSLMRNLACDLEGVVCMTRAKFMQEGNELPYIRNIVMDEVHHYQLEPKSNTRKKGVNWLMKARKLISKNRPEDSDKEGYLWLFLDMFQKENKFSSGIPPIHKQKQRVELEQIVRCTPNIWEKVREKLRTVSILNAIPDTTERVYKALLEKSESPHNIVAEDNIVRLASARSQTDEFALFFQVTRIISDLRTQHWRAEDIGVLFSTLNDAEFFMEQYNNGKPARETLVSCTDDTRSKNCVCDSVRRFAGLDKPCIVLVEPAVIHWSHDKNAFEALAMSRAMVKLVIIEK